MTIKTISASLIALTCGQAAAQNYSDTRAPSVPPPPSAPQFVWAQGGAESTALSVGIAPEISFRILDPVEDVNKKPLLQLLARRDGALTDRLTIGGAVTAIANAQRSNRADKFGYLMRNPTSANQIGQDVSEALVHSAQFSLTANLTRRLTTFVEMLYHPQQSFGTGTITDLNRNQVEVRRAYVLWGDLSQSPVYFAVGKMDTPFGLNDSVSPFTNSTNWHAFSGLAYGAQAGVVARGLHVRAMAIQGGAQFRAHNAPVQDTNVPSRLNNYAVDVNYSHSFSRHWRAMVGASYTHASAYCQEYPVFHFNPCEDNNPAFAAYSVMDVGRLKVLGEYATATNVWPGSAVPDQTNPLSEFDAVETHAFTVGARYGFDVPWSDVPGSFLLSGEFSRFVAGDKGAPWERQDQLVVGVSQYLTPSVNAFGEYIQVDGFAPLNFISGGNFPDGTTWSERDAKTDVVLVGINAGF